MLTILWSILAKLAFSLLTESFAKAFVVHALEWAAKQSENEVDDKIVADVKRAWNVE
jgi:hypothetical protein